LRAHADEARAAHQREHELQHDAETNQIMGHWTLDDERWRAHEQAHALAQSAHSREHHLVDEALSKAEHATDKRFESVNQFREQLRDQARQLASQEAVDVMRGEIDRRFSEQSRYITEKYEDNRKRIEAIEKGDVKQEGKGLGQAGLIAAIVTAIVVAGLIIGIIGNLERLTP
jgi:F0F1-type ATP synthase membrane subunit b/b'